MYDFVMCDYNGTASPAQTEDGNANVGQHAAESVMVRNTNKDPYGKQLLLNYCYGHPDTTLILCPYGSGVNFINHARTGGSGESTKQKKNHEANVKIVWSQHGTTNQDDTWFTKDPSEMKIDYNTKVAFDYIATKDIQEGDEILLDYGTVFGFSFDFGLVLDFWIDDVLSFGSYFVIFFLLKRTTMGRTITAYVYFGSPFGLLISHLVLPSFFFLQMICSF